MAWPRSVVRCHCECHHNCELQTSTRLPRGPNHATTAALMFTDGKPMNEFGLGERAMDKAYTMAVVEETHQFWRQLISKGKTTV